MTTLQEMLARRRKGAPSRPKRSFSPPKPGPVSPRSVRFVIMSYDRPDALGRLLDDIEACIGVHTVSVAVYDDASPQSYAAIQERLTAKGWEYCRAPQNHGKQRFWQWVSSAYAQQRSRTESLFVLLPDDVRLCLDFLNRVIAAWDAIGDPNKVAMNVLRDASRAKTSCWTNQLPIDAGHVFDVGWVDGAALVNRRYFEALGWTVERIDPVRWKQNPLAGSGVGENVSHRLHRQNLGMYMVRRSLVAHAEGPSKMNAVARRMTPLRALDFVDGEARHAEIAGRPIRTATRAAPPKRLVKVRVKSRTLPNRGVRKKS